MNKKNFVYYLLYGSMLVDTINGVLIREFEFSISPFYKGVILLLCLQLIKNPIKYVFIALTVLIFLFSHLLYSTSGILKSFDWVIKGLYIYSLFLLLSRDLSMGRIEKLVILSKVSFVILAFNIWLGFFGFGYAQYSTEELSIGTRGFMYAGNETSVAIMCSSAILMAYYMLNRKFYNYLIFSIFSLLTASLTTMKVPIFSILLMFLFFPLINAFESGALKRKNIISIFFFITFAPLLTEMISNYVLYNMGLIERISYFYEKNGLFTTLLSMRNIWALDAVNIYLNYGILKSILGAGLDWTNYMEHGGIVEMDPIDILLSFGLAGIFLLSVFVCKIIAKIKTNINRKIKFQALLMISLLISVGTVAGHVAFSGIAAHLVASVLAYGYYFKPIQGCKKND